MAVQISAVLLKAVQWVLKDLVQHSLCTAEQGLCTAGPHHTIADDLGSHDLQAHTSSSDGQMLTPMERWPPVSRECEMHQRAENRELSEARETDGQAARIQALPGLRFIDVNWLRSMSHLYAAWGLLIQGVLPACCKEEGALERTAGAIAEKEPMMKRAPPKKNPAAAYQDIQWAGVSK